VNTSNRIIFTGVPHEVTAAAQTRTRELTGSAASDLRHLSITLDRSGQTETSLSFPLAVCGAGRSRWIFIRWAPRSNSLGLGAGIAIRRFHRRPARLTRTRFVRPFKKGDRPLCPLKIHFVHLRDCGLGTEWSVPFLEPRVPFYARGKNREKNWVSPGLIPFRKPRPEAVCSVRFFDFAGLRGRPGFLQWRSSFSSIWSTNSGSLWGWTEKWIF